MKKILAMVVVAAFVTPMSAHAQSAASMTTDELVAVGTENVVCGDRAVVGAALQGSRSIIFTCGEQPVPVVTTAVGPRASGMGILVAVAALVVVGALAAGSNRSDSDPE